MFAIILCYSYICPIINCTYNNKFYQAAWVQMSIAFCRPKVCNNYTYYTIIESALAGVLNTCRASVIISILAIANFTNYCDYRNFNILRYRKFCVGNIHLHELQACAIYSLYMLVQVNY